MNEVEEVVNIEGLTDPLKINDRSNERRLSEAQFAELRRLKKIELKYIELNQNVYRFMILLAKSRHSNEEFKEYERLRETLKEAGIYNPTGSMQ